ncbi:hypothetical protein GCM10020256_07240 [Streptomyces thermocoprophilus]
MCEGQLTKSHMKRPALVWGRADSPTDQDAIRPDMPTLNATSIEFDRERSQIRPAGVPHDGSGEQAREPPFTQKGWARWSRGNRNGRHPTGRKPPDRPARLWGAGAPGRAEPLGVPGGGRPAGPSFRAARPRLIPRPRDLVARPASTPAPPRQSRVTRIGRTCQCVSTASGSDATLVRIPSANASATTPPRPVFFAQRAEQ